MARIGIAVLLMFFTTEARAWYLLEPFFGYNRGQEQTSQVQGIGYGARLGLDFKSFFLAADIGMHNVQQGSTNSVSHNDTGLTFGGRVNDVRLWYGMITTCSFTVTSGGTSTTTSGTGSKFGVGGKVGSKLYLNIEARTCSYTDASGAATNELGSYGFLSLSWLL